MNDFTKDELEDLQLGINNLISIGSCDSTWNADVRDLKVKLQSLIDNYCEHEWAAYPVGNPMAYERSCEIRCSKCGERPNVNQ